MNSIMLDLEAFGDAIVAIGACYFSLTEGTIGDEFYRVVSLKGLKEQQERGIKMLDFGNLKWWMGQTEQTRAVFTEKESEKVTTVKMLVDFAEFCSRTTNVKVWGNGVDYDNASLRRLYEAFNIKCPFHYRFGRCYRTMKAFLPGKQSREGVHNALNDARNQAQFLLDNRDELLKLRNKR